MAHLFSSAAAAVIASVCATSVAAQEVTLKIHHFMSETAALHEDLLVPFAQAVEAASDGRIEIELYASMSLGGRPGDLYDQAADGAADIILTLPGYTAGRFTRTEVFELPFLMSDTVAGSKAFYDLVEAELQDDEYDETHILSAWVHGPGLLHTEQPINTLEDIAGRELRGPTRMVTDLLGELGATPVGMPLPLIPESLSKGVITGAALPWEITPSIRMSELVSNHTEFGEGNVFYTATFILAMNHDVYDDLPDDLRAILDAQTGKLMAERAGAAMVAGDVIGRQVAEANNIIELDADEVSRWIDASAPVYDRWIADAEDEGFDGQLAVDQARDLINANQ